MANFNNIFAIQDNSHSGNLNGYLTKSGINPKPIVTNRSKTIDPQLDATWGGATAGFLGPDSSINPYYNYFFSGQDVSVTVDGTQGNKNFSQLPISGIRVEVSAPKMAIYGFWSYSYDAIAHGARSISALMEIYSPYPGYMTDLLQEVSRERMARTNEMYGNTAGLNTDDENTVRFWGGDNSNPQPGSTIDLFQQHPPFDLILIYGQQSVSISNPNQNTNQEIGNNPLFVDTNELLVENVNGNVGQRVILKSCQITQYSQAIGIDGAALSDLYQLTINDIIIPSHANSIIV